MRAAVVSQGSPDYLIDILGDGFIRLLGRGNVYVRFNTHNAGDSRKSQLYIDFADPNFFPIEEADVLVMSTRTPLSIAQEWKQRTGRLRVAMIDGEDDTVIRSEYQREGRLYFKREFLRDRHYPGSIKPLPFGAIPETVPEVPARSNPVFFKFNDSDRMRGKIARVLASMGFPTSDVQLSKEEYNRELVGSLVGVSIRGVGWDTYRYWETAYFGCAPLYQRGNIVIPEDFAEEVEAVYFETPEDFRSKLANLLSDRESTERIGMRARKACMERHLSTHRAQYVLSALL